MRRKSLSVFCLLIVKVKQLTLTPQLITPSKPSHCRCFPVRGEGTRPLQECSWGQLLNADTGRPRPRQLLLWLLSCALALSFANCGFWLCFLLGFSLLAPALTISCVLAQIYCMYSLSASCFLFPRGLRSYGHVKIYSLHANFKPWKEERRQEKLVF